MGKAEVGTPKWIGNKIKSKGLQKLRWYCQMCQKQCRDENGFKCHTTSEAHQRQLLLFAEKPGQFLDSFSQEFESEFLNLLKRCHGTKRTFANAVYQEYIKDKEHVHMNATKWVTLTGFVQHLGRTGKCTIDDTEKGWYITWIDRDPETIARQEALSKKEKLAKDDDEKMAAFIRKQVDIEKRRKGADEDTNSEDQLKYTELKRSSENEKIKLGLKLGASSSISSSSQAATLPNVFKANKSDVKTTSNVSTESKKRKPTSALEEIMQEEESKKKSALPEKMKDHPWLMRGIVVKIVTKSLGEKYYKQKGRIHDLIDKWTAIVMTDAGAKVKLDQTHLETVIPAVGRKVIILRGIYKAKEAILTELNVEKFSADLEINDSACSPKKRITLPYEDFSKKA